MAGLNEKSSRLTYNGAQSIIAVTWQPIRVDDENDCRQKTQDDVL